MDETEKSNKRKNEKPYEILKNNFRSVYSHNPWSLVYENHTTNYNCTNPQPNTNYKQYHIHDLRSVRRSQKLKK